MVVLLLLFVVLPIVELYALIQVSQAIGLFDALGLMLAISIVGAWMAKRQGLRTLAGFSAQIGAGKVPSKEIADGLLLFLAGALLLAPGFVTDVFGVLLLLPPVRALVRRLFLPRLTAASTVVRFGNRGTGQVFDVTSRENGRPPDDRGPGGLGR